MTKAPSDNDDLSGLDTGYYSSFLGFQAPLPLSWIAASRGVALPWESFLYLEAGTGQGNSLAALADANPGARFIGIEPDRAQIESAQALVSEAALTNIELRHAPLEDAASLAASCDIVTLSGLYSWWPKETRFSLAQALTKALKPGGLLCVQYGALPGNAHADLTYLLIKSLAAALDGEERSRLGQAVARVNELAGQGALYFKQAPAAALLLAQIASADERLAMREILHNEGRSLAHPEVAEELGACGLSYLGNAQIERNHLELMMPPGMRALIESGKSQAVRELMLDYVLASSARVDIFAKEPLPPRREPADLLAPFLLARLKGGVETLLRQQLAQRTGIDFTAGLYDDLLRLVGLAPISVQEILDHAEMRRHARARVLRAIQFLVGLRLVSLVRARKEIPKGPLPEKVKVASAFNRHMLSRFLPRQDVAPFASKVSGLRVTLGPADRYRLHVALGGALDPVLKEVTDSGAIFTDAQGKPTAPEAVRQEIMGTQSDFRARDGLLLYQLGILIPA